MHVCVSKCRIPQSEIKSYWQLTTTTTLRGTNLLTNGESVWATEQSFSGEKVFFLSQKVDIESRPEELKRCNMFLLNKQFYCNTAYTETPVVHPVINKENNKNKLNLRRHSLEGQWFSMPLWTGLGRGRRQWRPETESSSLVLACSHTIFIMSNIKSVEIGWIFFPRFAHRHL